jgi:hypothetical protein
MRTWMRLRYLRSAGVVLAVFAVALIVSVSTSGVISDIAFVVYAAAFIALVVLLIAAIVDLVRGRGRPSGRR